MEAAFRAGEAKEGDFLIYEVWDAKEPVVWLVLRNLTNDWRVVRTFSRFIVKIQCDDGRKHEAGDRVVGEGASLPCAVLGPWAYCAQPVHFTEYAGQRVTLTARVDVFYPASRRWSTHRLGPVQGFLPVSERTTLKPMAPVKAQAPEKAGACPAEPSAPTEEPDVPELPKPTPDQIQFRVRNFISDAQGFPPHRTLLLLELYEKQLRKNGYEPPPELLETIRELREALEVPGDVGPR